MTPPDTSPYEVDVSDGEVDLSISQHGWSRRREEVDILGLSILIVKYLAEVEDQYLMRRND